MSEAMARELPAAAPRARAGAINTVLETQRIDHLRAGAQQSMVGAHTSGEAVFFQALLEVGYLVASADGLAEEERNALAELVEEAVLSSVDRDTLRLHFEDLGASSEILGRRERLARVAADLEDDIARREAVRFATVVGIADGRLDPSEYAVLAELGSHFDWSADDVAEAVDAVVAELTTALEEGAG